MLRVAAKIAAEEIKNFDYFHDLKNRFIETRGPNQIYWREKSELEKLMPKDPETLLFLLRSMMITRRAEEMIKNLYDKGLIPGSAFFGRGNEATSCGVMAAMKYEDPAFPLHRDLGCDFVRGAEAFERGDIKVPLANLFFAQYMSRANSPCRGRDGNIHWGIPEINRYPMISHLGTNISVACGAALLEKFRDSGLVAFTFIGDGATSTQDFQALNQAAARELPLIVVIDNNQWAFRTTPQEQTRAVPLSLKALAFGMRGLTIDGTDILSVYAAMKMARELALEDKPVLIESVTFRMLGHSVYDSYKKYVPAEDLERWAGRDPIEQFENYLREKKWLNDSALEEIKTGIEKGLDGAVEWAKHSPQPEPEDLYAGVAANEELQKFIEILCRRNQP